MKNTITQITRKLTDDGYVPQKLFTQENIGEMPESPELGTAYHKALEECIVTDKEQCYGRIADYDDESVDKALLTNCYDKLSILFDSQDRLTTESQFMMNVPYNELMPNSLVTDKVLVQGVVDLIIHKPNGIIVVDYKYSSSSSKTLKKRYSAQVNLYALACAKATHQQVLAKYIYSIKSGELIEI